MTGVVVILAVAIAALTVAVGLLWRRVEMLRVVLYAHLRGTVTVVHSSEYEAAARLGFTIGAISRAGYRHGRLDIGRRFNAVARRERTAS